MKDSITFQLGSFSGPLEFLIALIQSHEINIEDIPLREILVQYSSHNSEHTDLNVGAEVVGSTSFLLWFKSKQLLPRHEQLSGSEEEQDPCFAIIHHLIDYCRFREAAKQLSEREQRQSVYYFRGVQQHPAETKKTLGIEHLTLDDFASLFRQLIRKSLPNEGIICEEEWKVSDKIAIIRNLLQINQSIPFIEIFCSDFCREELIVIFLAVLEMMKGGELSVVRITNTNQIVIASKENYDP